MAWAAELGPLSHARAASTGSSIEPTYASPAPTTGILDTTPMPASPMDSISRALGNATGYVSTGFSTAGGAGVEGGIAVPVIPGRVTIDAGGGTGQVPVWTASGRNHNTATAHYNSYHADVTARVADGVTVSLGIAGANLSRPGSD
jgi:hypothetical protein